MVTMAAERPFPTNRIVSFPIERPMLMVAMTNPVLGKTIAHQPR